MAAEQADTNGSEEDFVPFREVQVFVTEKCFTAVFARYYKDIMLRRLLAEYRT